MHVCKLRVSLCIKMVMLTNMFDPPHEYYVTDISAGIHFDRQLPLSFTKTSMKRSVNEVYIERGL